MWDPYAPWPQGSFQSPVPIPTAAPGDAPLLCVAINAEWMQYVIGALKQLMLPATWGDPADPLVQAAQSQANDLIDLCCDPTPCAGPDVPATEVRFTAGCGLQTSIDGGDTWAAVPGWLDNAPTCFSGFAGAGIPIASIDPGLPPNPYGATVAQQGCNIAGYLASDVIKEAINAAVAAINADQTALDYVVGVAALIPGEDLVLEPFAIAGAALYSLVTGGTLADYSDAGADATLWADVTCAIYGVIGTSGRVTAANFADVHDAIAAVVYAHPAVISAIAAYWVDLGLQAVEQLQIVGAVNVADCSACSGWCYHVDFTAADGGWLVYPGGTATWVAGVGWTGVYNPATSPAAIDASLYRVDLAGAFVTGWSFSFSCSTVAGGALRRQVAVSGGVNIDVTAFDGGAHPTGANAAQGIAAAVDELDLIFRSAGSAGTIVITDMTIQGSGTNPFGASNC